MLIRFKGAVIEIEGNHNFSLEVTESGMKFALEPLTEPKQETCQETIAPGAETVHRYELRFTQKPQKGLEAIKNVREYLKIGLGQAKAIVDGTAQAHIVGPEWTKSEFAYMLDFVARGCYTVSPPHPATEGSFITYK